MVIDGAFIFSAASRTEAADSGIRSERQWTLYVVVDVIGSIEDKAKRERLKGHRDCNFLKKTRSSGISVIYKFTANKLRAHSFSENLSTTIQVHGVSVFDGSHQHSKNMVNRTAWDQWVWSTLLFGRRL